MPRDRPQAANGGFRHRHERAQSCEWFRLTSIVLHSRGVKLQGYLIGVLGVMLLCVHCTLDLDKLSAKYGQGGAGGTAGSDDSQGGMFTAGNGESGGMADAEGGTTAGAGEGGQAGSNEAGEGGSNEAGMGGTGGTFSGGGRGGTGGSGGAPLPPCPGDGCVLLTIPADTAKPVPAVGYQQFITINLDIAAGVDLSDSIITAHIRAIDFRGTTETVQLYASALPNYDFWGNNGATLAISTIAGGGTLTMDLTNTGTDWDATHAISIGLLFHGGSSLSTVKLLVEDITATVKADPTATPKYGPWLFTKRADVNQDPVEKIPASYNVPNVIFPNAYQAVTGTQALWVPPTP